MINSRFFLDLKKDTFYFFEKEENLRSICHLFLMDDKQCPMCKSKNYDDLKGCKDCGFSGLCLSDDE